MSAQFGGWLADPGATTEAYAAYVNAPREHLDDEQRALLDEDCAKARAAMERAWLESKPVTDEVGLTTHEGVEW